jgi:hypothetical protein
VFRLADEAGGERVRDRGWCLETSEDDAEAAIAQLLLVLGGVTGSIDLEVLERELAASLRVALWRELLAASTEPDLALLGAVL